MRHAHLLGPVTVAALLALGACGGGGGDDAPAQPPAATGVGIGGTAATGAPIAGGAVSVTCASGSGQATTAANGSYSVTITSGVAPCLVQVTGGGSTYYSMVAAGSANPSTVNLTPLTTLMTAQVLGAVPTSTTLTPDIQARLTAANIASARTALTTALNGRVDISGFDPITTAFAIGDATDQRLDQFGDVLAAAGTDLQAVAAALVANPGSPDPVRNLVAPASATCPSLRSGEYWNIEPRDPQLSIGNSSLVVVDATALTATFDTDQPTPTVATLTPVAGEPCRFTIPVSGPAGGGGGGDEIVVSSSGIFATRFPEAGTFKGTIGFPRTTLTTAELAGSYNYVGYGQEGAAFVPINGTVTIAADGTLSNSQNFINLVDDTQPGDATPRRLIQRPDGTYNDRDLTTNVTSVTRWLPHKTADGVVTIFIIGIDDGLPGVAILRRQTPVDASAQIVGTVTPFWEMVYTATGVSAINAQSVEITSINTTVTPNTVTRIRAGDSRVDVRAFNAPRTGMLYRALNSCTTGIGGPTLACAEGIFLPTQGTGFTVVSGGAPTNGFFSVSVLRP
ncbi:hypothetical protein [uncultured Methylibium sp.]|uniref:hypothetical protein n=1 Tax=uncultured Methylibium sp. TaxID=381093 RepID=UPI0025F1A869|nr:hypothetical protein [uncultured Methylibium sp.]